ncbi:hydroxymethylbilane synthase [Haloplanus halobius]|uniref:hydroxymethylbilane synthase n=1 Tax=Haloplanus halobius TaxID=2934938 RepID=UPI00200DE903|nr:hydroxymethylbilane synthase [Haloplanus sp. XH21]
MATRGSDLALRQTASVRDALSGRHRTIEVVEVSTEGDRIRDELIHRLGKTGAFVRALDEKVLDGDVDAAVHSMKDMPTESPDDLVVAGVPDRAPAGDVLVTPDGTDLDDLPAGAVVGTSSLRRGAQLRRERDDLQIEPLRGNVDTRLEKLLAPPLQREHQRRLDAEDEDEGEHPDAFDRTAAEWFDALNELERQALERDFETEYDGIVLAEAGIRRSGLFDAVETVRLPKQSFVPAPGQGAIAVTAKAGTDAVETIHNLVDDPVTRVETTVERTILAELGGGCIAPIGVHALVQGEYVQVTVQVLSLDGSEAIERSVDLPIADHADAAASIAADLREAGAADLIDRAREEADE